MKSTVTDTIRLTKSDGSEMKVGVSGPRESYFEEWLDELQADGWEIVEPEEESVITKVKAWYHRHPFFVGSLYGIVFANVMDRIFFT